MIPSLNHKKTEILVTGGAGYIGQSFLRCLERNKIPAICLYRKRPPESLQRISPFSVDLAQDTPSIPCQGIETVVHLAWERSLGLSDSRGPQMNGGNNLHSLRNLIAAMEREGVRRLIFLSIIGAKKDARYLYAREKYEAEHEILNSKIPEKIIVRSSLVYGGNEYEGDFLASLRRLMRCPGIYPLPKIKGRLAPIFIEDLNSFLLRCLSFPIKKSSAIVNVLGTDSYKSDELLRAISKSYQEGRIPLGSFIGDALIRFLERKREEGSVPGVRFFLDLASGLEDQLGLKNPLYEILPKQTVSLQTVLQAKT